MPRYQEGNNVHQFLVIFEKYAEHYGASAPDLPGCVAVGDTLEEAKQAMREAIEMHIQGMLEDNEPIPPPQSTACYIEITVPNSVA
jgi:predicted RNase H-like HicB family nuclease